MTDTTYPQDALARQILADGFLKEPSGYINGNLSGAFGFAGITPDQISPETLALAQHCGLTHTGNAVWTYESADDQRTPDEIAAVRASIAAAEVPAPIAPVPTPAPVPEPAPAAPVVPPAVLPEHHVAVHVDRITEAKDMLHKIEHGFLIGWTEITDFLKKLV